MNDPRLPRTVAQVLRDAEKNAARVCLRRLTPSAAEIEAAARAYYAKFPHSLSAKHIERNLFELYQGVRYDG